jgi:hypothetical protein
MPVQPASPSPFLSAVVRRTLGWSCIVLLLDTVPVGAQSLAGSRSSLQRQSQAARHHDYTYLKTASQVRSFADRGLLVRVRGDHNLALAGPSFPYARPEVELFLTRLARQYRAACGEPLVVTSLTRPSNRQPRNASHLSVHPTGMAVDLRRSGRRSCRVFLEKTLLQLEAANVLEATRERWPPHYHVSLYPAPYLRYLGKRGVGTQLAKATSGKGGKATTAKAATTGAQRYKVRRGDSLWTIARRHDLSVERLRRANGIDSPRALRPGQMIDIPAR